MIELSGLSFALTLLASFVVCGVGVSFLIARIRKLRSVHQQDVRTLSKFSSAVMNSGALIAITDAAGLIEYVNGCFTEATGYSEKEALGKTMAELVGTPPTESATPLDSEWHWSRRDGSRFWVATTISAVTDDAGNTTHHIISGIDISDLKIANERMEQLALFDALTGLANRRLFLDRMAQAMQSAQRHQRCTGMLFLDLDQFKRINDTLGHDAGDLLLLAVADRLKSCVRAQDTVARLGGDEFTILLNDIHDANDAALVAKNILRTLKKPIKLKNQEIIISTSIGISLSPNDGNDPECLMKNADLALYRAKERGRDQYHFFTEDLNRRAIRLMTVEQELRLALASNEFSLSFQPQFNMKTKEMVSVEALIRWQHPTKGCVDPNEFIAIAEETGLIVPIGNWVMRNACMQIRMLHDLTGIPLRVAVNLSSRQFRDPNLEKVIRDALESADLAPEFLEIEVTESTLMDDMNSVIGRLEAIKSSGVTITIDDFGTGYSSLRYLKRLPVDILKVDREFVSDIPDDLSAMEITSAVIAIAHKLNLKVIAEGVETQDQRDFLLINKCDFVQGFFFSEPLSFEQLYAKLNPHQERKTA